MKKLFTAAVLAFGLSSTFAMDENGWASIYESIAAFEKTPGHESGIFNRPGYVKPIITNLGNVLNSNWYSSASVPTSFAFEAGLPFALIPIGNDDQTFTEKDAFGNAKQSPTIFGTHGTPGVYDGVVYGNETLNGLGVFTYPYLQLAGSFYNARLVLRGMYLPAISELRGFSLLGFGLQYSFGHFFQYMLPPAAQGLDVSLVFGYNSSSIGYQPEDYTGELDLDISAWTIDVVIGYKPIKAVEIMLTLGYQSATMESSGHLVSQAQGSMGAELNPNITVDGNCGFKFGLEVAFQLGGSFNPVVGFDYSGKSSFTTNILYFKNQVGKDKTPDEIAKEKGYVRNSGNDSKSVEAAEDEDSPKARKKKALREKRDAEEAAPEASEDDI